MNAMTKKPLLVAIVGVSGSGKSTLGLKINKLMAGSLLLDPEGIATVCSTDAAFGWRTENDKYALYSTICGIAGDALKSGRDTIWCQALTMDAGHPSHPGPSGRRGLISLCQRVNAAVVFVQCVASYEVLHSRLSVRNRKSRSGVSWLTILDRMLACWEPIPYPHIVVDSTRSIELIQVLEFLEVERLRFMLNNNAFDLYT